MNQLRGLLFPLMLVLLLGLPLAGAQAIEGVGADLYYLAPDAGGVLQVWRIGDDNQAVALSAETADVIDYAVAFDGRVAHITARSLGVDATAITSGGALDSPSNINLGSVDWSPDGNTLAITAYDPSNPAGASDAAEGLWLYELGSQTWTQLLTVSRDDAASTQIYTDARWSPAGDRLLVDVQFAETSGLGQFSLNTQQFLLYNVTGTNGFIDERGYGRGSWSPDAAAMLFSDVPVADVGNGFVVPASNYLRTYPLLGAEAQNLYLSHPRMLRGSVIFLLRDFINSATEAQIWQIADGNMQQLGTIPTADLREVAWSGRGDAVVYTDDFDGRTGAAHLLRRVEGSFVESPLPEAVTRMANVQWGPDFSPLPDPAQVSGLVFKEPLAEDETGASYAVEMQWNPVEGVSTYRMSIDPALAGQANFDIASIAARVGALTCDTEYRFTIAALNADGSTNTPSTSSSLFTPPCDAVVTTQAPAAETAPTDAEAAPTTEATAAEGEAPATEETEFEPLPETVFTEEPEEPIGPATVTDLTAGELVAGNTLADGTILYNVDLTWTAPEESFGLYLISIDPPIGASQRAVIPVRGEEDATTLQAQLQDLVCSVIYRVRVQTLAEDGSTVLATSPVTEVTRPTCP